MIGRFATADDLRRALETRLVAHSARAVTPLQPLRVRIAVARLLARLFASDSPPWVVKGGVAMELRFRPQSRTTRDLDLGVLATAQGTTDPPSSVHDRTLAALRDAAAEDLGDGFEFRIGQPAVAESAPGGGRRCSVDARLAGRTFEKFRLDVGFGELFAAGDRVPVFEELLAFAGLPPCSAVVVPAAWQFADKLAIYSHPWHDRQNTRSKDLVDLAKLIEHGLPSDEVLRAALVATHAARADFLCTP